MSVPRTPSRNKTHVRCGTPGCDWGTPLTRFNESEMDRGRREFREHCIGRHGLDPKDTESRAWFDLEALTLTLLDD
jgi:hypothetical protein